MIADTDSMLKKLQLLGMKYELITNEYNGEHGLVILYKDSHKIEVINLENKNRVTVDLVFASTLVQLLGPFLVIRDLLNTRIYFTNTMQLIEDAFGLHRKAEINSKSDNIFFLSFVENKNTNENVYAYFREKDKLEKYKGHLKIDDKNKVITDGGIRIISYKTNNRITFSNENDGIAISKTKIKTR